MLLGSALVITGMALLFPNYTCIHSNEGDCVSPLGGPLCGIGAAIIVLGLAVWIHAGVRSSLSIPKGATDTGVIRMRKSSITEEHGLQGNANVQVPAAAQERPWFKFGNGPGVGSGGNNVGSGKGPATAT